MSVSTIMGVPIANIAKINGIPIANILKWNGQTIEHGDSSPFITEWVIPADSLSVTLPLTNGSGETYNCIVYWGDGTNSTITSWDSPNKTHTYVNAGTYQISIYGTCEGWSFANSGDKLKITKVIHWGSGSNFAGFVRLMQGFYGCTNLISIGTSKIKPSGNKLTTFNAAFAECSLDAVPAGLLDDCIDVTGIGSMFYNNQNLETIPSGLFRNCTEITNANSTFYECRKLKMIGDIFYNNGEQATRFLNKSVNFTGFFAIASFTGLQGIAPDLWNCNYGTGNPVPTVCFGGTGNSVASLQNYASIPAEWK